MSNILIPPLDADARRLSETIRQLIPTFGSFSTSVNLSSTVVTDPAVGPESVIFLTPTSLGAASLQPYIFSKGNQQFTVGHNVTTSAETFDYLVSN